jgi:hypothetical protein
MQANIELHLVEQYHIAGYLVEQCPCSWCHIILTQVIIKYSITLYCKYVCEGADENDRKKQIHISYGVVKYIELDY